MARRVPLTLVCLVLVASAANPAAGQDEPPLPDPSPLWPAVLSRVIDGNTLDVQLDRQRVPVGLLGADTPNLRQPCGPEAMQRTSELLSDHNILLSDQSGVTVDALGRRLFYVFASDGSSIDATLIAEGLAHAAHLEASRGEEMALLEADAQANGRGCLWSTGS